MTALIAKLLVSLGLLSSLLVPNLGAVRTFQTTEEVQLAEDGYFTKNNNYIQVLSDGTTPDGRSAEDVLGKKLPKGTEVHVFETPKGVRGYRVIYKEPSATSTSI